MFAAIAAAFLFSACSGRGAKSPRVPPAPETTIAIEGSVRGVAAHGRLVFVGVGSSLHAYRDGKLAWKNDLGGTSGSLALTPAPEGSRTPGLLGATVSAKGNFAGTRLRADPAAAVVGYELGIGSKQWTTVFDSTEWVVISSIAPLDSGFVVGGLFGGTLRVTDRVVTSAGGSDGFVARLDGEGRLRWLVRLGGPGADGVQGVATRGERIAIAGTFSVGAELQGHPMPPYDDRLPFGDAFIAELDAQRNRKWLATIGGRADDTIAGVTIDERGNVVVAGSGHEVIHVGSAQLVAQGTGDGFVVWFGAGGEKGAAVLVGGIDFDGLRAITAVGDQVVVGGFFSGSIRLAERTFPAGGGDDAFLATLDTSGTVARAWHVGGEGREEIAALSAVPGGFIAGVAHTANANVEDTKLTAPKDPMLGGAVVVRGVP